MKKIGKLILTGLAVTLLLFFTSCTTGPDNPTLWDGSVDTAWYKEDIKEYHLKSAAELAGLAKLSSEHTFSGKTIYLEADIDLNNLEWTPIGTTNRKAERNTMFQGNFNGKGHSISNLKVIQNDSTKAGDDTAIGLFGCVSDGKIENLTIASGLVENKYDAAAGFIGAAFALDESHTVTISNCVNGATIKASNPLDTGCAAAGFVARAKTNVNILNCTNKGPVIVDNGKAGGIVSMQYNQCRMMLISCRNEAPITSTYVGAGIVAWGGDPRQIKEGSYYLQLNDCVNTGDITVEGEFGEVKNFNDRYGDNLIAVIEGSDPPMNNCKGTGTVKVEKVKAEN